MDDKERKVIKSMVMVTQIGISMLVPVFLCAAIGVWVSRLAGTQVWFLVFIFLGVCSSLRNLYIITKSFYSSDMKKEHEKLKYIQELKDYSREHPEEGYTEIVKTKRYPENKARMQAARTTDKKGS